LLRDSSFFARAEGQSRQYARRLENSSTTEAGAALATTAMAAQCTVSWCHTWGPPSAVMGPPSASYGPRHYGAQPGSTRDGAAAGEVATRPQRPHGGGNGIQEIRVYEIKEVLRLWLRGTGTRKIAVLVDWTKAVQRYIAAAAGAGLEKGTAEEALDDVVMAQVASGRGPSS